MSESNHITFPGLGLEFNIDPVAFTIGNISVQWYGIILCAGIICAFMYFLWRAAKTEGIESDHVYNVTLIAVVTAIFGARFVYVITNLDQYDTFLEMINIPGGGLAIYGGIIFGGIATLAYSAVKKLNTYALLDAMAPAVLIGQIIGRWGNFVNAEAYGYSAGVEKLPWRMGLDRVYVDGVFRSDIAFVHPTFLYEALWNLLGFILISIIYKRKKFDGQIVLSYIAWYGLGRGFIEMLRSDSLRVLGLKFSVLIGFASFAIAVILMFVRAGSAKKELATAVGYESKFAAVSIESEADAVSAEPVPFENDDNEDNKYDESEEDYMSGEDDEALDEQDSLDQ